MTTILFGKLNSRKKHTQKVVINGHNVFYYEKKKTRWEFITTDISKIPCDDPEFIKLKSKLF